MPQKTLGTILMVVGIAIIALSLLADVIGIGGGHPGIGVKQILGAVVGLIVVVVGNIMRGKTGPKEEPKP